MPSFEEFLGFIGDGSLRVSQATEPEQAPEWAKNKAAMKPHFEGTMPEMIKQAFPNETAAQLAFRERVFRSESMPRLQQAIEDVRKMVLAGRFEIDADAEYKAYLETADFGGFLFEEYLFTTAYPARVLDPNGLLAVIPLVEQQVGNSPVPIELRIIDSADIAVFRDDIIICLDTQAVQYTNNVIVGQNDKYLVFADQFFCRFNASSNEAYAVFNKPQDGQFIGAYTLGGAAYQYRGRFTNRQYTVFRSDFYKAVPGMDELELLKTQLGAATVTSCFPHRIERDLDCAVCDGTGEVLELDPITGQVCVVETCGLDHMQREIKYVQEVKKPCGTCKGKGTLAIGALDSLTVPSPKQGAFDAAVQTIPLSDYIHYVTPDVATIQELRAQFEAQKGNVDEVLNLVRPSRHAESGVSKEKDREGKETALAAISKGIGNLAQNALEAIIRYRSGQATNLASAAIAALNVVVPESFDIMTEGELEAILVQPSANKPLFLSMMQAADYVQRKKADIEGAVGLFELVSEYTYGFMSIAPEQLATLAGLGQIDEMTAKKAIYAYPIAQVVAAKYSRENNGQMIAADVLFAELDRRISAMSAPPIVTNRTGENLDPNGRPQ
jgi:hypothetical protein